MRRDYDDSGYEPRYQHSDAYASNDRHGGSSWDDRGIDYDYRGTWGSGDYQSRGGKTGMRGWKIDREDGRQDHRGGGFHSGYGSDFDRGPHGDYPRGREFGGYHDGPGSMQHQRPPMRSYDDVRRDRPVMRDGRDLRESRDIRDYGDDPYYQSQGGFDRFSGSWIEDRGRFEGPDRYERMDRGMDRGMMRPRNIDRYDHVDFRDDRTGADRYTSGGDDRDRDRDRDHDRDFDRAWSRGRGGF